MPEEYESLRKEILEWQNRRFLLVAASITLVTGVLGLGLNALGNLWVIISSLLFLFLACATILSWYAGKANAKIGAYLIVFHEEAGRSEGQGAGWESRLARIKNKPWVDLLTLNHSLTAIYVALGIVSFIVPWLAARRPALTGGQSVLILFTAALLVGALLLLWQYSYPRADYIKYWREVKREEQNQAV